MACNTSNIAHLTALHVSVSNASDTEFRISNALGNEMDMASLTLLIRYRFNATSHSLASARIPLASNSHSIEYMYYWARTRSRARARKENGASSVEN